MAPRQKKKSEQCTVNDGINALYQNPMKANRSGALFSAFPYPTKISPEAIALFIAMHTKPGDTIFDGFAGSGTTGLAALLCGNPSEEMRNEAKQLGLEPNWGPRNAILYEVGVLGSFIASTLTNPPNPHDFFEAASVLLQESKEECAWMYEASDPDGNTGKIRHVVWSDILKCPSCRKEATLWDACVSLDPAKITSQFACPNCGTESPVNEVKRVTQKSWDGFICDDVQQRKRKPVYLYGVTGKKNWSRAVTRADVRLIESINAQKIPKTVPNIEVPWGDLYRSGYHTGITHLHHFYTKRNLLVFADLWRRTNKLKGKLRDALRFWLLSYNASHATNMTRVVAKSGQKDLVVTSAQPGVLYFSGLPVEKNLHSGVERKLKTITSAFETIYGGSGSVEVFNGSSCNTHIDDKSIDYVFTDPPFGGNIPYAEINFINEAWLKKHTKRKEEIIISSSQGKSLADYEALLTKALQESSRILKKNGKTTLVFHSSTASVWNALQSAYKKAGYSVENASLLNKTQGSFKQVTTKGSVKGDPVILLSKKPMLEPYSSDAVWDVAGALKHEALLSHDPVEHTPQRLYSRLIAYFLERDQEVPIDADKFYKWYSEQAPNREMEDAVV